MDQVNLAAWAGKQDVASGRVDITMAAMLAATLDHGAAPAQGDILPQLWHWCAILPTVPNAALAGDGHPALGGFLPPVPLERRMWAGGALTFHAPLHVGEVITRHSCIRAVSEKEGAAGPMVFVTVDHEIHGAAGLAITERQDIVYLAIPDTFTPPRKQPLPEGDDYREDVKVNEALLFRYSACTFNAHRIHFDLPYAQQVEHYPGLVVHGPLQATRLIAGAARTQGRVPDQFTFRGVHPLFHDDGLQLRGAWEGTRQEGGQQSARDGGQGCAQGCALRLWAGARAGHQTMQASATWMASGKETT